MEARSLREPPGKNMDSVGATSPRLNQSFFKHVSPAIRTLCRPFEKVIRKTRIGARDTVEDIVKGHLRPFAVAVLTGIDQPLGFANRNRIDQDDVLPFRW
jgi:hypothetical protein